MIREQTGNLLEADAEAVVNTVNTVGVMGKGIALQFKRAYPANFKAYAAACKRHEIVLGRVHVFDTGKLNARPRYIINFPTKGHWRSASRLGDIQTGLQDLVRQVRELGIHSIALPPLGCGNGGLRWADVEPMIHRAFAEMPDVDAQVFAPGTTPSFAEMANRTERPRLTRSRALVLNSLERYVGPFGAGATPIEVQKVAYFMERLGEPLDLRFAKGRYGPYSDRLTHVVSELEGHYIAGFGDGSKRVAEADPIVVLAEVRDEVDAFITTVDGARERVDATLSLLDGFDSAYGTELLATVDWVITREHAAPTVEAVLPIVRDWNRRKAELFQPEHIALAIERLESRSLV